jgi:hypothetical protein
VAAVEQWLAGLAPGTVVTVTPVVDLSEHVSVDAYEVPDRLRNQVLESDLCCVFPWCGRPGLFDVDHVEEYVPVDEGAPPGQTNSHSSGRLCRYHHRVKTHPGRHGRWRHRRRRTGTYLRTSPLGRRYAVDTTGTRSLD